MHTHIFLQYYMEFRAATYAFHDGLRDVTRFSLTYIGIYIYIYIRLRILVTVGNISYLFTSIFLIAYITMLHTDSTENVCAWLNFTEHAFSKSFFHIVGQKPLHGPEKQISNPACACFS